LRCRAVSRRWFRRESGSLVRPRANRERFFCRASSFGTANADGGVLKMTRRAATPGYSRPGPQQTARERKWAMVAPISHTLAWGTNVPRRERALPLCPAPRRVRVPSHWTAPRRPRRRETHQSGGAIIRNEDDDDTTELEDSALRPLSSSLSLPQQPLRPH
jgi:hypothetical protein